MAVDESNIVKKITLGNVDMNTETFNDETKDIGAEAENIIVSRNNEGKISTKQSSSADKAEKLSTTLYNIENLLSSLSSPKGCSIAQQYTFSNEGEITGKAFSPEIPEGITHRRILGFYVHEMIMLGPGDCKMTNISIEPHSEDSDILDVWVYVESLDDSAHVEITADIIYVEW